jgi:hypothetical protein
VQSDGGVWAAVAVAFINMIGAVALAFIKAKWGLQNSIDKNSLHK